MIHTFEQMYLRERSDTDEDFLITKDYIPEDGDYIILDETESGFEELDRIKVKMDKKTRSVETTNPYYDFIRAADYMSRYLESNKAIADKNIHSNNYLTLFLKKENLFNGKINEKVLSGYYEVFKDPYKKYSKPKLKAAYKTLEEEYGKSDVERVLKIEKWVKNNIFQLDVENDKSYLKLFFYCDLEEYRKESEKYILTNIYNSADYSIQVDHVIYGVPNNNMGLNSKKPYLELKSRKNTTPILLSQEDVLIQKKFFDYLNNLAQQRKVNLYIDESKIYPLESQEIPSGRFTGYYMRLQKGMETEIHDFDTVVNYSNEIRPIQIKNVLRLEKSSLEYRTIHTLDVLKAVINEVLFRKLLETNYFTEAKKITIYDECVKRNLLMARKSLFNWFYKGVDDTVWNTLKICSPDLIKNSIMSGYIGKASEQYNLYISLKNYFEGDGGDNMIDITKFREKINQNDTGSFESDDEFYFAVGQLANYFLTLSKAGVKYHSLSKAILNVKTAEKAKNELRKLYHKYNYSIVNRKRFNNMYSMVCLYEVKENQINEDILLGGYLHSSLIYDTQNSGKNIDPEDNNLN